MELEPELPETREVPPPILQLVAWAANERGKLVITGGVLRARAKKLRPAMHGGRWELSMYCTDGLGDVEIWDLLNKHANASAGRVDFDVEQIVAIELGIDANWDPIRHVNLIGWPDAEAERESLMKALSAIGVGVPAVGADAA